MNIHLFSGPDREMRPIYRIGILLLLLVIVASTLSVVLTARADDGDDGTDSPTASCFYSGYRFGQYGRLSSQQLLLTAGHCPSSGAAPLWKQYSQGIDAQLIPVSDHGTNTFQDNLGTISVSISGATDAQLGQKICTIGSTPSSFQCGNVIRQDYAPSYVPSRTPDFLLVTTDCEGGDSGRPWFINSVDGTTLAVGITSGRNNATGYCIVDPISSIISSAQASDTGAKYIGLVTSYPQGDSD
jgi:hypothetical protein